MTLHVGLVGSDGIVLAGDTLQWANPNANSAPSRAGISTWLNQTLSKIKISDDGKIAVSCAQDLREAYALADAVIAGLSPQFWEIPEGRIQDIAQSYSEACVRWHGAQSLIVLSHPAPALYLLECLVDEHTQQPLNPQCRAVPMYAFDGDALNGAIFWAMRYYRTLSPHERTIHRLMRLGAQIVADAGEISSGNVGGLEVVYSDTQGIHRLAVPENAILLQEAQERSSTVRSLIIGP